MSKEVRKRYCLVYETQFDDFVSYECDYSDQLLSYMKQYDMFNQYPSFTIFMRASQPKASYILFGYDHGQVRFMDLSCEHQLIFKLILQLLKNEEIKKEKLQAFENADEIERELLRQGDIAINDIEGSEEE